MQQSEILKRLRTELKKNIDESYKKNNQNFFKEKISCYGVRTPIVRCLAKRCFREVKSLGKADVFKLCRELFKNKYNEEATIAIQWAAGFKKEFESRDFAVFES